MIPTVETPADGFTSINEMAAFWTATHGETASHFEGVLIRWGPLATLSDMTRRAQAAGIEVREIGGKFG